MFFCSYELTTIPPPKKKNHSNAQTKMAASMRLKTPFSIFLLNIFCLFLSFAVVNSDDNSTNTLNVSVFGEETNSYFDLFNTSTPPPTVTDLRTTAVPVLPTASSAEPLPVSGRLPTPVTDSESLICNKRCKQASCFVVLLLGSVIDCR